MHASSHQSSSTDTGGGWGGGHVNNNRTGRAVVDKGSGYGYRSRWLGWSWQWAKCLVIPDNLFQVVRGASGVHGVVVLLFEVRDGGELISGEGVRVGMGQKGREGVADWRCHGSLSREHVLKGGRHW